MNVALVSLDQSLVSPKSLGDTLERLKIYAAGCGRLTVFIPTQHHLSVRKYKNLHLIPVRGSSTFTSYLNLIPALGNAAVDLVSTNDPVLGALALLSRWLFHRTYKIQVSVFGQQNLERSSSHPKELLLYLARRFAIKHADRIRTDTAASARFIIFAGLKPKKLIDVIPVPPSPAWQARFIKAKPDNTWRRQIIGHDKHLVLTIGTLTPNKDYSNLINAIPLVLKQLPQTHFVIVGSGPEWDKLHQLTAHSSLSTHLTFLPSIPYDRLPALYHSADLFVLPSFQEGLPRVLMEAALSHCPIVTTDIHGAPDLITHQQSGLIVPKRNPQALGLAIMSALRSPSKLQKYTANAFSHAKTYLNFDTNCQALINSWQHMLGAVE